jgi:hypothetical protein
LVPLSTLPWTPFSFSPNVGQGTSDVDFMGEGALVGVTLSPATFSLAIAEPEPEARYRDRGPLVSRSVRTIGFRFANANANTTGRAEGRLPTVSHYLDAADSSRRWIGVPNYQRVLYDDL